MQTRGERLVPGSSDPDLLNEHVARYWFAEPLARGARVLDAGCGVGYGCEMLAASSSLAVGVDIAPDAIRDASLASRKAAFACADCTALPFGDASFELVVAFEVIEHLEAWGRFVAEAARLLTPAGAFVVSTPNRDYYQSTRSEPNPFHVHEFDRAEFLAVLSESFAHCEMFHQNHVPAVSISSGRPGTGRARVEPFEARADQAHYLVAVCSQRPVKRQRDLAYVPSAANVLRDREEHIAKLRGWVDTIEARHSTVETRMSRELARWPYRVLRRLGIAPRLPTDWGE